MFRVIPRQQPVIANYIGESLQFHRKTTNFHNENIVQNFTKKKKQVLNKFHKTKVSSNFYTAKCHCQINGFSL